MSKYSYFNRDISWLSFNFRVLQEAMDSSLPIYERIKFLAIYSNNLEEFYQVRMSYYRELEKQQINLPDQVRNFNPAEVIRKINKMVSAQQIVFHKVFEEQIIPELERNNIFLLDYNAVITKDQEEYIRQVFYGDILTSIQPVLLVKKKVRPFLKTGHIYLTLELVSKEGIRGRLRSSLRERYALVKIPTDHGISRFIELPEDNGRYYIMFLEDVVMRHVDAIFPGYTVKDWYSIKLTRDADLEYDDYEGEDLIDAIEQLRSQRSLGKANRFQYDRRMPLNLLHYLIDTFHLSRDILVKGGSTHNFRDFFKFPNPLAPDLEIEKLPPLPIPDLDAEKTPIAALINKRDYMINLPYQSFEYFLRFLKEASRDPDVTEIKATQYRVADQSSVINTLIEAAENGKKVTVFVELKARFDEVANLQYASEMMKAGIKIIYSIPKLKVHAKLALIIRSKESKLKTQVYLGTGNFNEKTARIYADHGLFTSDKALVKEIKHLFRHLEDQEHTYDFEHILIPGFNLLEEFNTMIEKEISHARAGKKGYILLKMNGLQDPYMVDLLYKASEAGVKIDLIIRGVCILKPYQPYSKNIRVIRIIDRFLEHARVFVFHNGGDTRVFLGSADWMKRNLYRRIECVYPIYNEEIKQELLDILDIQLRDNVKACEIDENMYNIRIVNDKPLVRSQMATYEYLKKKYQGEE
ncbi:MAG: polyphosphate kinase 1 [Bacteroidota bacterium]